MGARELIVANLLACFVLCFVIHKGGHYLAALYFGRKLKFRFAWGKFYVPRYIWDMPHLERSKQRIIAAAGFCAEAVVAGILAALGWPWMGGAFVAHFCLSPVYSVDASDFKWLYVN